MKRRVVVTGLGMITPVGNDVATTWRSLAEGKSGAAPITRFDASNFPVRFACEVKGFDPLQYMDRKEAKRADMYTQYAMGGAVQAMRDAGFKEGADGGYEPERTGVILGSGIGGLKSFEEQHDVYRERGPSKISPFFIPMFIADIAAGIVSMRFNAKGPNYATVSACATSAHAIGDAFRMIAYGDRRLREHEGALGAQRQPGDGVAPLRPRPRRLRHGRGRGDRDPRGAGAREAARRAHLRRGRGRRRPARHAPRAAGRGAERGRRAVRERARHVHAGERSQRDPRHQGGVRRERRGPQRQLHQELHGPHARSCGVGGVHRLLDGHPGWNYPADDQLSEPGPRPESELHAQRVRP